MRIPSVQSRGFVIKMRIILYQSVFVLSVVIATMPVVSAVLEFADVIQEYNVTEDTDVKLSCRMPNDGPVIIFEDRRENDVTLVSDFRLEESFKARYQYEYNTSPTWTSHNLTVSNVNRLDSGEYVCLQTEPTINQKSLLLNVHYRSSAPTCSTSHPPVYLLEEVIAENLTFICKLDEIGNPRAKLQIDSNRSNQSLRHIQTDDTIDRISVSFLPNIDMDDTKLSCTSHQEVFSNAESGAVDSSCEFVTVLFLDEVTVTMKPANLTIKQAGNYVVKCESNAGSSIAVTWHIPTTLPEGMSYAVNEQYLIFTVDDPGQAVTNPSFFYECECKFKGRVTTTRGYVMSKYGILYPSLIVTSFGVVIQFVY